MTLITSSIDAGSGTGYTTTQDRQQVTVESYVYISGTYGIVIGPDSTGSATGYSLDSIYNYGSINAYSIAAFLSGDSTALFNQASGTIAGYDGVFSNNSSETVVNSGTISGSSNGVYLNGDSESVANSGTIAGGNAIAGAGTFMQVSNTGVINGTSSAFSYYGDTAIFRNSGQVVGNVIFHAGANVFDGRGGTLNGEIFGGSNADTIHLGNDGETVRGRDGVDNLYAGAGADTFVFTRFSKYDVDRVHGFDAAHDTIQLEHASFTRLTVDAPVAFATGTKAANAHDFLFYNPTSGALYYDADGSGAKAAAHVIAHLDTGLHLTSHDFQTVAGSSS